MNTSETVSFDKLPEAVCDLSKKMDRITEILLGNSQKKGGNDWLNIDQLREYLPEQPAKSSIYGWVHKKLIPHNKRGKSLYFLKSDIDQWLLSGRKKTLSEIKDADHTK